MTPAAYRACYQILTWATLLTILMLTLAELGRLEDALAIERARVDRILNAALEPEAPHG